MANKDIIVMSIESIELILINPINKDAKFGHLC